jgi:hypothetical protein
MKYSVIRNTKYDFLGQSYATNYPNLHKYPATMLPQIGSEILSELNITSGKLLDPYCGSGSSFASGLESGITQMYGFDINPLAILISKAKFTKISLDALTDAKLKLRDAVFEFAMKEQNLATLPLPNITNIDFWYSKEVLMNINIIRHFIYQINDKNIINFLLVPFSETVRECSYTRNNEFKLFKMKSEDILKFNPDVFGVFFKKLNDAIFNYSNFYLPKLTDDIIIDVQYSKFQFAEDIFDVVLTSPPYGDSRTTVAYGQFSTLANEWAGINYARKIDTMLMGGAKATTLYQKGLIADYINQINNIEPKRALEVSSFYADLDLSIRTIAKSVKKGGKIIYVVGNRTVKNIQLPTDQFIAEQFELARCNHIVTYERALSSKAMPSKNSPTNIVGATVPTMLAEYMVVCEKR